MTEVPLIVRCVDETVFPVDRKTYEPETVSCYDAYCFSDPRMDVEYISHAEWLSALTEKDTPDDSTS